MLVIERTIGDHHCQEKLKEFRKLELSANKEMSRALSTVRKDRHSRQEDDIKMLANAYSETVAFNEPATYNRQSLSGTYVGTNSLTNLRQLTQCESVKEKDKQKDKKAKIESDIQKLEREKTVKTILNDLGISSPKELPESI